MSGFISTILYIAVVCVAMVIGNNAMQKRLDKAKIKYTGTDTLCVEVAPGDTVCYSNGFWRTR